MNNFKIEKKNDFFYVVPTAHYLETVFDRHSVPYDTNWEIYKLYNFLPKELFQYLTVKFNAIVSITKDFPYATIKFSKELDAVKFSQEVEQRSDDYSEKSS